MRTTFLICALLLAGCGDVRSDEAPANEMAPGNNAVAAQPRNLPPAEPVQPGQPGGRADDRTPIPEAPFEARSAQGAANLAQTYFALVEQSKFAEARSLWLDRAAADAFERIVRSCREFHSQIGAPGGIEGAAGSLYVEIPIQPYGRLKSGTAFAVPGKIVLSRVNDVPGSTAGQRQWHIRAIEMPPIIPPPGGRS
jgi:hypothetical protein